MPISDQAFAALVSRMVDVEKTQAVGDTTQKNIERRLASIETTLSRLMWLVIAAIGSAAMAFILHGGLYVH
jgi:hypothetical protein